MYHYFEGLKVTLPSEIRYAKRYIPMYIGLDSSTKKWIKRPLRAWGNEENWYSLDDLAALFCRRNDVFAGLVLKQTDPWRIVDLDHVIDKNGLVQEIAEDLWTIFKLDAYKEYSFSGSGLHILARPMFGDLPKKPPFLDDKGNALSWSIEIFGQGLSLLTLTGAIIGIKWTICEDQRLAKIVRAWIAKYGQKKDKPIPCAEQNTNAIKPANNNEAYLLGVLKKQIDSARSAILGAPKGERNATIFNRSRLLGGYFAGGLHKVTSENRIKSEIFDVAVESKYVEQDGEQQAWKSINTGFIKGQTMPIVL